jgi:hypothetical protein
MNWLQEEQDEHVNGRHWKIYEVNGRHWKIYEVVDIANSPNQ